MRLVRAISGEDKNKCPIDKKGPAQYLRQVCLSLNDADTNSPHHHLACASRWHVTQTSHSPRALPPLPRDAPSAPASFPSSPSSSRRWFAALCPWPSLLLSFVTGWCILQLRGMPRMPRYLFCEVTVAWGWSGFYLTSRTQAGIGTTTQHNNRRDPAMATPNTQHPL